MVYCVVSWYGLLVGFHNLLVGLVDLQTVVRGGGAQNCSIHNSTQLYYTM